MCTILSSIYLSTYRYKENDIFSPWSLLLDGSHLVPLEGEGEEGEHAHADGQGGGEGVDAAVHRPELPGAVTVDNMYIDHSVKIQICVCDLNILTFVTWE